MVLKYHTACIVHEYRADPFFKEKVTWAPVFVAIDFIRGEEFFCKISATPDMQYDKFCAVPKDF